MAFLMTPPTRATLPVAEMSSVRTHTQGMLLRHRGQLVLVVSLHALAAVAALAAPRIVGLLVDTVTQQGDVATVDRLAVGLAVAVVAQTVLTWFARRSSFRMGEDLFAELREQFMDRVVSLPLSTVERAGTGDLVSRTTNDVEALSHVARFGIPSIFVAVVTVAITVRRGVPHRLAWWPWPSSSGSRCCGSRRGGTSGTRRPATCANGPPTR